MVRPKILRHIAAQPIIKGFRPEGIQANGEVILSLEEYEAIRLIDYDGLDQSQAAEVMNVSRQTLGRILRTGRFTLSQAVVDGKYLKVEGGCYTIRQKIPGRNRHGRYGSKTHQRGAQMNNNSSQRSGQGNRQGQSGNQGTNKGQGCGTGQGRGKGRGQGCSAGQRKNQGNGQKNR